MLPPAACTAHVFPALTSGSLISIGTLCNHGYITTVTANSVTIDLDGATILRGSRSTLKGLWHLH
jgi:hypothetical protein